MRCYSPNNLTLDEILEQIANDWDIFYETERKKWKGYPDSLEFLDEMEEEHRSKSQIQNQHKKLYTSNEQAIESLEEIIRVCQKTQS